MITTLITYVIARTDEEDDNKIIGNNPLKYDIFIPNVSFADFMLAKIKQFGDNIAFVMSYYNKCTK